MPSTHAFRQGCRARHDMHMNGLLSTHKSSPGKQSSVRPAYVQQVSEEVVALVLRLHEDKHFATLTPLAQDLEQPQEALAFRPELNTLMDVLVDDAAAAHLHLYRVVHHLLGKRLYLRSTVAG